MDIEICEVGPRDGLQNEPETVAPETRAELCNRLISAGVRYMEAASFVRDDKVPRMAGAETVISGLADKPGLRKSALVLNLKGYDRLGSSGCNSVRFAFCVTDTFNLRNQGATVDDSIAVAKQIIARARRDRRHVGIVLGASFGCPFEGEVSASRVLGIAEELAEADEIVFADTIGVGVPSQVKELLGKSRALGKPLGLHLHNTRNTGYANAYTGLEEGVSVLDSSVGGIGGCPFSPFATGNIATEDLVYLLQKEGIATGIDLDELVRTSEWLEALLGRGLPGMLYRVGRKNG